MNAAVQAVKWTAILFAGIFIALFKVVKFVMRKQKKTLPPSE